VRRIAVVAPTTWDLEELARFAGPLEFDFLDDACAPPKSVGLRQLLAPFDVLAYVDRLVARIGRPDGIVGTDEYLAAAVAAIAAERLGLPGPPPASVLLCQHKFACRLAQRDVVPDAVPGFEIVDPSDLRPPSLPFPLFVKPVRGTFSVLARRVDSFDALRAHVLLGILERRAALNLLAPFNALLKRHTSIPLTANYFIAEEPLAGSLATVEAFASGGDVRVIGISDSVFHPGTMSFLRFDYPSRLPDAVQRRMEEIARALVPRLGLDRTVFNVEMFADGDHVRVLEVNPRMAYQFADLYEKVDGINTYEIQLALATGVEPRLERGRGKWRVASSFVFRKFGDARLVRQPAADALKADFPDARLRTYGTVGRRLSDVEKGVESYRYGIVNLGGDGWDDLAARFERAKRNLAWEFR